MTTYVLPEPPGWVIELVLGVELSPQFVVAVKSVTGEEFDPSEKVATCTGPVERPSVPLTGEAKTEMSETKSTLTTLVGPSSSEKRCSHPGGVAS